MSVWHCDTPDQARTYATKEAADAEEAKIRRRLHKPLVVVWESSELEESK